MTMKSIPLIFAIALMCIVPFASAQTYSGTAPQGQAIWALDISAPWGTSGGCILKLENGDTVTGTWDYGGLFPPKYEVTLDGDSSSYTYLAPLPVHMQIWNGDNVTYARELKLGYRQYKGGWNDVITTSIAGSPVMSYTVTTVGEVDVSPEFISYSTAVQNLNYSPDDLIAKMREYLPMIWGVFESLIYWLNLLFVENLTLTVSLYMAGTMAYAVNTSKNIFIFYKTWFRQQRALFEFMANSFLTVIQIVTSVGTFLASAIGAIASKILGLL